MLKKSIRTASLTLLALALAGCDDLTGPSGRLDGPFFTAQLAAAPSDLGTLPGGSHSAALGINSLGQVVGWSQTSFGQIHGAVWSNGAVTEIGTFGGDSSVAQDINDNAQVVGWAEDFLSQNQAFLWSSGSLTPLGTLGGGESVALGINNSGVVVGWSQTFDGFTHAFMWANGTMTDLGTLPGGNTSFAWDINDAGQVVGISDGPNGFRAFVYQSGTMTDAGALGDGQSQGLAISDEGWVAGTSLSPLSSEWHAFVGSGAAGGLVDLGTLGGIMSAALGVQSLGQVQVVGWSYDAGFHRRAALWTPPDPVLDLGTLGGSFAVAHAVNGTGQIAGESTNESNQIRAVVWTIETGTQTVPEEEPLGPVAKIDALIEKIEQQRDAGQLSRGQANSMIVKLNDAKRSIEVGAWHNAANMLRAFAKHVHGLMETSVLSSDFGTALLNAAQNVLPQEDILTAVANIDVLIHQVEVLRDDGLLNPGRANSLIAKLATAKRLAQRYNWQPAGRSLGEFTRQVHELLGEAGGALATGAEGALP